MKINTTSLTRFFHRTAFALKRVSPDILVATGVIGMIAGTVMACKETVKAIEIKKERYESLNNVSEAVSISKENPDVDYTDDDRKNDIRIINATAVKKYIKTYAPSVSIIITSAVSILSGFSIIRKRNVGLAAAYSAIDAAFNKYRENVRERFGDDVDNELRYNIKRNIIEDHKTTKSGKDKIVKTEEVTQGKIPENSFDRIYDDMCLGWSENYEECLKFLRLIQSHANDVLHATGHLYLNQVYEWLGFPGTQAGHDFGWLQGPDEMKFVSFGLDDLGSSSVRDFVNRREKCIMLTFNIDDIPITTRVYPKKK